MFVIRCSLLLVVSRGVWFVMCGVLVFVVYCLMYAACSLLLVVGCWLFVVRCFLFVCVLCCLLFGLCCSLFTVGVWCLVFLVLIDWRLLRVD